MANLELVYSIDIENRAYSMTDSFCFLQLKALITTAAMMYVGLTYKKRHLVLWASFFFFTMRCGSLYATLNTRQQIMSILSLKTSAEDLYSYILDWCIDYVLGHKKLLDCFNRFHPSPKLKSVTADLIFEQDIIIILVNATFYQLF